MPNAGYSVINTFGSDSGNVSAGFLDADFAQPADAFNTLANFSNYFVDSGGASAIVVTVASPLVVAYTAGLALQIQAAANSTGATTINVNGMGIQSLVYPGTNAAILSNQIVAGAVIQVIYDGVNFEYLGPIFGNGSFVPAYNSGFSSVPPGNFTWFINGTDARLYLPPGTGTSNGSEYNIDNLPGVLYPVRTQVVPAAGFINNGVNTISPTAAILTVGSPNVSFTQNGNVNGWSSSGTKGTNGTTISWTLT
jgi:hypothetical protein